MFFITCSYIVSSRQHTAKMLTHSPVAIGHFGAIEIEKSVYYIILAPNMKEPWTWESDGERVKLS